MDTTQPVTTTVTFSWTDYRAALEASRGMSGREFLDALQAGTLPMPPFVSLLGVRIVAVGEGTVTVTFTPQPFMHNGIGLMHGGVAATIFDTAVGCASLTVVPPESVAVTADLQVRYFKPLTMQSGTVRCEGRIIHAGKRMITAEGRLYDGADRLCGHATSTLALIDAERVR